MKLSRSIGRLAGALPLFLLSAPAATQDGPAAGPNVTQICLAPAVVEAAPSGVDPLLAVRETFTGFLTGPSLAVKPLSARLQSQVREEAQLAGCSYLLLPTIKHQRKTGGGLLGKMASGAVQQGAWSVTGATGSTVGRVVAGAAAGAASSAAYDYAASSRTKDELTLSYRLELPTGAVLLKQSEKRKAKSDGEDLLTPMVQRAAEAVVTAAARKP
jgi:hypothetical protein